MKKIHSFRKQNKNFANIETFIDFIQSHQSLLKDRPISLCHGDYHVGNMMIDLETKKLVIIDFGSIEIGDPMEEFNRMIWKGVLDKTLASARNVDMTTFLGLLFCLFFEFCHRFCHRLLKV